MECKNSEAKSTMTTTSVSKSVRFGSKMEDICTEYAKGNKGNYRQMLNQLNDQNLKSSKMVEWLQDCTDTAHLLDKSCTDIVNAILKVRWMEREAEVVSAYRAFVIALVTSNPVHIRPVLKTLTSCFIAESTQQESESVLTPNKEIVYGTVHEVFKTIFTLIPQSTVVAEVVFRELFPYMRKPLHSLEWYVKNLMCVTTYQPSLRLCILELIVKCMIDLDVHSPRHEIEEKEEVDPEGESDELFKMDEEMVESTLDGGIEMKHALANKLDVLMHILLEYVYDVCYRQGQLQLQEARTLFRQLVFIFDNAILPVHLLIHVQFIIFYICSFKQSFAESFIEHCWKKVTNVSIPAILRQASVSYITSMVARASYVPLSVATACLDSMTAWAQRYLNETTDIMSSDAYRCDVTRHGTFYTVCQAIFYVVIFRHKQIINSKLGCKYIQTLNLQHLVVSHLNPLKACLSSVVTMFSSTMRMHQLVYCDTIVERNNRQLLPIVGISSSSLSSDNPLDSFFPFDPYLLKRSSDFINPHYKEWEGRMPGIDISENEDRLKDADFLDVMDDQFASESLKNSLKNVTPYSMSPGFGII